MDRAATSSAPVPKRCAPCCAAYLAGVGEMVEANAFDPATATGRIRLLMPDLQAAVLAPHLLARLGREAPSLDLDIVAPGTDADRSAGAGYRGCDGGAGRRSPGRHPPARPL